ncbi:hypothetical protein MHU86_16805 [Fragilaria crotonensis]|nr:hypothetical protein MHU86_16805 [Fragilaria crotonensis]
MERTQDGTVYNGAAATDDGDVPAGGGGSWGRGHACSRAGGAPAYEPSNRDKVYSPYEHERIRVSCGLTQANYEASRPPIYAAMLTEGRTVAKVEAVLQRFFAPEPTDWDPVKVYVSTELTRDVKDLRFGYGNENTYDTCHRGITPFAVLQVSMEQQNKRRKIQERADRATHISTEDVREMEVAPGSCPSTYFTMLSLLRKYIRLLTVLFGAGCAHLSEVQGSLSDPVGKGRCIRTDVRRLGRGDPLACLH